MLLIITFLFILPYFPLRWPIKVEHVIAIEILAACAALDHFTPLKSTSPLEAVRSLVRSRVAPFDGDRFMAPDIDAVRDLVRSGAISAIAADAEREVAK
jgi:histidine ammonia-lyase